MGSSIVNSLEQFRRYCRQVSSGSVGLLLARLLRSNRSEAATRASFELTNQALRQELRLLTLNMWGLSPLSGHFDVEGRCDRLFEALHHNLPDIIFFQELWHPATKALIERFSYPFVASDGKHGTLIGSSGLAILSRFPIIRQQFNAFQTTAGMEHLVRKGVLFAEVDTPQFGRIELVNTHLISEPERFNRFLVSDRYVHRLRVRQISELRSFLDAHSHGRVPRVLAGDFNLDEGYEEYPLLRSLAGEDLYRSHLGEPIPGQYDDNIEGVTFDPPRNPYSASPNGRAERIDHIWINNSPAHLALGARRRFMKERVSDHYGVEASLAFPREIN